MVIASERGAVERHGTAFAALAEATQAIVDGAALGTVLDALAVAAAELTACEVAVVRVTEPNGELLTRAVAGPLALAAELAGAYAPGDVAAALAVTAARTALAVAYAVPVEGPGGIAGSVELLRGADELDPGEQQLARVVANHVALALRVAAPARGPRWSGAADLLELTGDALAASSDEEHAAVRIAQVAATVAGADAALIWRLQSDGADEGELRLIAAYGDDDVGERTLLVRLAGEVSADSRSVTVERLAGSASTVATLQLGEPTLGALQLVFPGVEPVSRRELGLLASFAVRVAHALRSSERARELGLELDRSRALLAVVGQAISELSLSHTLETAVERVAELLGAERVAIYLEEDGRLTTAAARRLAGPHEDVAGCLHELALGPSRGRGILLVEAAATDERLADVAEAVAEAGIEAAIALPLHVAEEAIGLLVVYAARGRVPTANESALLVALSAQLAVAVQNARLHERAKLLGEELETVLAAERDAARRLQALYEISRSFAQTLSLDSTLDTLAETVVEALGVDAAVILMPDERGSELVPLALYVDDERVGDAARAILNRPQPLSGTLLRRLLRTQEPLLIDAAVARELGGAHSLLAPFLDRGSTAALIPIATPAEVLATLLILSLDPGRPVDGAVVDTALSIAAQAALAIDNARLYSQQKAFADAMQRSLLPRETPTVPGLEVGEVYESSARLDVGGDVYDFLTLGDGRLAVVLGDVTGHGVDATADMAMAKFVFRSLAREHSDPGEFLAAANEVVTSEIASGKFITMAYVAIDAVGGRIECALAGHPQPRLVLPDGEVIAIEARGLALGIDGDQSYETVSVDFPPGATVVLYTDGVNEARRRGELYGLERFDALLSERRDLPARELALETVAACRAWTGGELGDDVAVVVIKRDA